MMSSISHGSFTFFFFLNLTTVILAVWITHLENSRSGTHSQIPQNSNLEFLFTSRAGFPSPTIWFCVLGVADETQCGHLLCIFPLSLSSSTAPWTVSTSYFSSSSLPLPPHTHTRFCSLHVLFILIAKKSHWIQMPSSVVGPAGNKHRRSTQHSTEEKLGSKGNSSQLLRESRFW